MPYSITFEPVNYCNLKCPECPTGRRMLTRDLGEADVDTFKKLVDDVKKHVFYLNLYFQGEPFLHPQLLEMIRYAADAKMYVAVSTNAHFIDDENAVKIIESGIGRIIISLDGLDQATYEKYRAGGDINKVLRGLELLIKAKKAVGTSAPFIIIQSLALSVNEAQLPDIVKFGKSLGADRVEIKSAQIYDFEKGNELLISDNRYSRYKIKESGEWQIKNKMKNRCKMLWNTSVITYDGFVVPCCFDKDAEFKFGCIKKSSLRTIWKSKPIDSFRLKILRNRKEVAICGNCTEGLKK